MLASDTQRQATGALNATRLHDAYIGEPGVLG